MQGKGGVSAAVGTGRQGRGGPCQSSAQQGRGRVPAPATGGSGKATRGVTTSSRGSRRRGALADERGKKIEERKKTMATGALLDPWHGSSEKKTEGERGPGERRRRCGATGHAGTSQIQLEQRCRGQQWLDHRFGWLPSWSPLAWRALEFLLMPAHVYRVVLRNLSVTTVKKRAETN